METFETKSIYFAAWLWGEKHLPVLDTRYDGYTKRFTFLGNQDELFAEFKKDFAPFITYLRDFKSAYVNTN